MRDHEHRDGHVYAGLQLAGHGDLYIVSHNDGDNLRHNSDHVRDWMPDDSHDYDRHRNGIESASNKG
jgi:hypothetical protein